MDEKWRVEVWNTDVSPRYVDAHERHRERGIKCGTVEANGRLFHREYASEPTRAVAQLKRRYPNAEIETTRYEFRVFAWFQTGDRAVIRT